MQVTYNGRQFAFRHCDTFGMTQEKVQKLVDEIGEMQYEAGRAWLFVRGIGYGWEV